MKESEQKLKAEAEARAKAEAEAAAQLEAQKKATQEAKARAKAEEKLRIEAEKAAATKEKASVTPQVPEKTGECECCGRKDIKESNLIKIDSGQMFCHDCLKELRG
jgi:membrane protein involved in colicin uptake